MDIKCQAACSDICLLPLMGVVQVDTAAEHGKLHRTRVAELLSE